MNSRILFVDDEAPIRELLSLFFRKKSFDVASASTIAEAKELTAKERFDLAILDVNLAGANGLDLLESFKRDYPAMPVIIFTGISGDENLLQRALAAGANGFMRKTEPLGDLFSEVQRHLANRQPSPA